MEYDKFVIEQVEKAQGDFTSLGRWGWALAVTFLTQILLQSANSGGNLFPNIRCEKGEELGWPFLGVILLGTGVYAYFVFRARSRLVKALSQVRLVAANFPASAALKYTLDVAPSTRATRVAMALRIAIFAPLVGIWLVAFDVCISPEKWAAKTQPKLTSAQIPAAFEEYCKKWEASKAKP